MKHFRFTLQALLTVREREERSALEHYARQLQLQQLALDDLTASETELAAGWGELRHLMTRACPVADLVQRQDHCQRLGERLERQRDTLARAEAAARLALLQLITAQQNREVVVKFLETQQENYRRECTREEQKLLDELARRADPPSGLNPLNPALVWN